MTNRKIRSGLQGCLLVIVAFSFAFNPYHSSAQQKIEPPFKRCPVNTINYDQGLMNNSINGIITDMQGFTWISTSAGIQRYNGYSLQTITPVADGDTIRINYPVCFLEAKNHSILIGYANGILSYDPGNNSFKKLVKRVVHPNTRSALMPLKETDEGLWCFEENKGIVVYNNKNVAFTQVPSTENANVIDLIRTEDYNITRKLVAVNEDFIFIRVSSKKIVQINTHDHQSKDIDYTSSDIIGLECNNSKLFVATVEGLVCLNINDGSVVNKIIYKQITDVQINRSTVALTADHHLLLSIEKRLFEMDTLCTDLKEIITLNREPLLKAGYIQIVYEDRMRRIWLLTHEDIRRIQNAETPFAQFIYPKEKDNFTRCIYYDKEKNYVLGGLWIGGIELFDSSGRAVWEVPFLSPALKGVLAIEKISNDHYLVVTQRNGVYIFRLSTRDISPLDVTGFPAFQTAIKENAYSGNLQRIDNSTVLICTKTNIFRCQLENNKISSAVPLLADTAIKGSSVSCFVNAYGGNVWISLQSGKIISTTATGSSQTISIPGNYVVRCMAEDSARHVWVGTERGLFVYDHTGVLIQIITRESGLLNDFIYALLPAGKTSFFASTNFGLSFISLDNKIKNYTRELGLQENEFNTQAGATSPKGKLFFGGINGITAFYPQELAVVHDSSLINMTRLVVNDSLYNSFGGAWKGDTIHLDYNQNHLQLDLAANGLLRPNEYLYKYRLAGFEKTWQTTSQPTGIRYTLQPGSYLLDVYCSPILFSSSTTHKTVTIIIAPPWWKRWWFVIVSVLTAAFVIFGISYFILRQRYQLKLKRLEIQQQLVNERERISRELHDNIGSQLSYISSNIDWLVEAPGSFSREEEAKRLSLVNDTAKSLVTDLRETIWAMKKESIMLDELADKIKLFLQSQLILQPQIETVITENISKKYSLSPTEALNIFRICQEAIVNSIRHSSAEKISLSVLSGTDKGFEIKIEDDGKGFARQERYNGHYGLENMTLRAAESGADLSIHSAPGKGTRITILKAS